MDQKNLTFSQDFKMYQRGLGFFILQFLSGADAAFLKQAHNDSDLSIGRLTFGVAGVLGLLDAV